MGKSSDSNMRYSYFTDGYISILVENETKKVWLHYSLSSKYCFVLRLSQDSEDVKENFSVFNEIATAQSLIGFKFQPMNKKPEIFEKKDIKSDFFRDLYHKRVEKRKEESGKSEKNGT